MELIAFLLCAAVIFIFVGGGYVFFAACLRQKEKPWLEEEKLKKTSLGKYYDYIAATYQWVYSHSPSEISIKSDDGLQLHGLWIPADNPMGTVIMAHGYRSSPLLDFGASFEFYHNLGMNLLIPAQRSHGNSQGKFITFGVKESQDMAKWIAYHNKNLTGLPVVLTGISMGASTMLYLADRELPENVRGLIVDCGFTSPKEIIAEVYRRIVHLPAGPVMWAADLFARLFAGFSLYEKDTRKALAHNRLPILMVHGREDGFVPCMMTEQGYDACVGEKKLFIVEGADHGLSFVKAPEEYKRLVTAFIDKHVGRTGER